MSTKNPSFLFEKVPSPALSAEDLAVLVEAGVQGGDVTAFEGLA